MFAAFLGWRLLARNPAPPPAPVSVPVAKLVPVPAVPQALPRVPAPPQAVAPKLPDAAQVDHALAGQLAGWLGARAFAAVLQPDRLVHRIVATVDALTRQRVGERVRLWRRVPGDFLVVASGDAFVVDPANARRYDIALAALQAIPLDKAVDLYRAWYPLFQQAYVELGYPEGSFHQRLLEVIDDLLDAPEPKAQERLDRTVVLYRYQDEALEDLGAGQKMLLRLGDRRAATVKAWLRALRGELLTGTDKAASAVPPS